MCQEIENSALAGTSQLHAAFWKQFCTVQLASGTRTMGLVPGKPFVAKSQAPPIMLLQLFAKLAGICLTLVFWLDTRVKFKLVGA